jgi:hypothetical protein
VNLAAGTYNLSFDAVQRLNYQPSAEDFQVLVDGQAVGTYTPALGYTAYTTSSFTVAAGVHTIAFQGLDSAGGANTAFIDAVQLNVVPAVSSTLLDAGFESPAVGSGYVYAPANTGWTFSAGAGIAGNVSAWTSGNTNAPEGTQVAFLVTTNSIAQSVNLAAGTYNLSFDAVQRLNYQPSAEDFQVLVDGSVVGTYTPALGYTAYTTSSFTVAAGVHTITFQGLDSAGGANTAFIDAVQLNAV